MATPVAAKPFTTLLNKRLALFGRHVHPALVHPAVCAKHAGTEAQSAKENAAKHQNAQRLPETNGFHAKDCREQGVPQGHHQQAEHDENHRADD